MARCESCFEDDFLANSAFILLTPIKELEDLNGNSCIPKQCPYTEFGCKEKFLSVKTNNSHVKNCLYRPMKCYQTNNVRCEGGEVDFELHSILNHLKKVHDVHVDQHHDDFSPSFEGAKIYLNSENRDKIEILCPGTMMECIYKYKGKYFFKNSHVLNGIRYWWFSLLGSEEQARKYRACLRIKKLYADKQNVRVPQWVLPIVSFRRTFSEVLLSKNFASFKLSFKSLDPYLTCDNSDVSAPTNCKSYTWCTEVEILTT